MAVEVYLGNPPAHIIDWIRNHSQPSELGIPLYFEGQEAGATVTMIAYNENEDEQEDHLYCNLECSTDNMSTWSAYNGETIQLDNCTEKRVYFRAPEGQPNTNGFYDEETYIYHNFVLNKAVKAGGNIQFLLESTGTSTDVPTYAFYSMFHGCTSLTQAPALPATTLASSCYQNMFSQCTSLTQAPALPATTLAVFCYQSMFSQCTSLTQAPALPATTLAYSCYNYMFSQCTSLTQAPALPATTLASICYQCMFYGCTSLTQAPALPATTLAINCYSGMFSQCTSLMQAPALPATTLASSCYSSMFYGCTSLTSMDVSFTAWNPTDATIDWMTNAGSQVTGTKTFTCPATLPNTTGNDNIPSGWTRVEK